LTMHRTRRSRVTECLFYTYAPSEAGGIYNEDIVLWADDIGITRLLQTSAQRDQTQLYALVSSTVNCTKSAAQSPGRSRLLICPSNRYSLHSQSLTAAQYSFAGTTITSPPDGILDCCIDSGKTSFDIDNNENRGVFVPLPTSSFHPHETNVCTRIRLQHARKYSPTQ
jgi:hypothetical protein